MASICHYLLLLLTLESRVHAKGAKHRPISIL